MAACREEKPSRPWIVAEIYVRNPTPPPPPPSPKKEQPQTQPQPYGPAKKKKARRGKRPLRPFKRDREFTKSLANRIQQRQEEDRLARVEAEYDRDERYGTLYNCRIPFEQDESDSWGDDDESDEEVGVSAGSDYGDSSDVENLFRSLPSGYATGLQETALDIATSSEDQYGADADIDDLLLENEAASRSVATRNPLPPGKEGEDDDDEPIDQGREAEDESEDDVATPKPLFQPWGDYCLAICRLSSWSAAKKYGGDGDNAAVRQKARDRVVRDMVSDGLTLIRRLEANSPAPFRFKTVSSLCYQRKSSEFTHFNKKAGKDNAMAKGVRDWMSSLPAGAKATLLVRGPDGLTVDENSLLTFLEMVDERRKDVQMIFQYNKVYNAIRPPYLLPVLGLGAVFVLEKEEVMQHLLQDGEKREDWFVPDVARFCEIIKYCKDSKAESQGIQDRNVIPDADQMGPKEGTAGSKMLARVCTGPKNK